jgi:hypothetical protein
VRAAPTTEAKVLTKLAADQAADVTGRAAGGDWLRVAVAGNEGFVSGSLMAESSAEEVADWKALKAKPSEKSANAFLAAHPDGYFKPKATALLAKLQAPAEPVAAAEPAAPAVVATAPAATQQAAVTPAPARNVIRISSALRQKVERYLKNSESFGQYYRFLAVNESGDRIGVSNCTKVLTWASSGCGGVNDPYEGAKRVALRDCGNTGCKLIYEGPKKLGDFEIEWY